jgi:hypothetical protein
MYGEMPERERKELGLVGESSESFVSRRTFNHPCHIESTASPGQNVVEDDACEEERCDAVQNDLCLVQNRHDHGTVDGGAVMQQDGFKREREKVKG